jgi:hypothetical protein
MKMSAIRNHACVTEYGARRFDCALACMGSMDITVKAINDNALRTYASRHGSIFRRWSFHKERPPKHGRDVEDRITIG